MLTGFMIPARHFPPMIAGAGYGSPSALMLGQQQQPPEASQSMPENDFPIFGDEDFESRSGSENIEVTSGYEQDPNPSRKKRHHRHTQYQIQELECFFKECPHPDDKQRKELGRSLGLEPLQIKFWFQNKRTQMKTKHERHANQLLRSENEKLRAENIRYKEALSSASCPNCNGSASLGEMSFDEHHLRIENVQLREEIDKISGIAARYEGKSPVSHPLLNASVLSRSLLDLGSGCLGAQRGIGAEMFTAGELLKTVMGTSEMERPLIIELAVTAMEELLRMAEAGEPLWFPGFGDSTETLNEEEYVNAFPKGSGSKSEGLKTEGTRETAMVMMNPMSLVEILMDVNQWSAVFSSIVSKAMTIEVFSTGVAGNYNGALQVMLAEYQVPSPLVHIRESLFVRYCKQHQDGTWAVVDASLDSLRSNSSTRCRRRPSGCLIQEMPNGYSKVIWVEHVEADDRYIHALYKLVINSGLAFGAKRWVAILERQCERLASAMARNLPAGDVGTVASPEGRKNLLKLAERMVISFCNGVTGSPTHNWSNVSEVSRDDIKISLRKCINDPGRPSGHVINAATSIWLPVELRKLFNFLRNETSRTEWDILSNNSNIQEVFHIANGAEEGNCVSILRVDNKNDILILQESCFNVTGSYVVYAPIDVVAMNIVLGGGDPDYVALLPSGFAVLPDSAPGIQGGAIADLGSGGSLLTIAFQILVDSPEKSDLAVRSVTTVNHLISCTADKIKAALLGDNVVQST